MKIDFAIRGWQCLDPTILGCYQKIKKPGHCGRAVLKGGIVDQKICWCTVTVFDHTQRFKRTAKRWGAEYDALNAVIEAFG